MQPHTCLSAANSGARQPSPACRALLVANLVPLQRTRPMATDVGRSIMSSRPRDRREQARSVRGRWVRWFCSPVASKGRLVPQARSDEPAAPWCSAPPPLWAPAPLRRTYPANAVSLPLEVRSPRETGTSTLDLRGAQTFSLGAGIGKTGGAPSVRYNGSHVTLVWMLVSACG